MAIPLKTKNKEIEHIFDRLTKYPVVRCDSNMSMSLGRNKKIRYLREMDLIFLGQDRTKRKGIVGIPPQVKIKKNNGSFFFYFE